MVESIDPNICYIKIRSQLGYYHIMGYYGSHQNSHLKESLSKLEMTIENVLRSETKPKILLCGDFNIHVKNPNKPNKKIEFLFKCLRYNKMSNFTCKRNTQNGQTSYSNIDLCFSSNLKLSSKTLKKALLFSDHKGFVIKIKEIMTTKRIINKIPSKDIALKIMEEILSKERPSLQTFENARIKYKNQIPTYNKTTTKF